MKAKFTVREAVKAASGRFVGKDDALDGEIFSVTTDSREANEGCLFVAIAGEKTDGHKYAAAAHKKGAVCAIVEHEVEGCPCIIVESSVAALQALAEYYRKKSAFKVVGITGSVGKTTCKELVASVLGVKYNVLKTPGNFNNEIGLPLTLLSATDETEIAVIEMGMSDFGEMHLLSRIARPDMCIITNIGHSHIGILGSQEGIFKAKCEIFDFMSDDAPTFLNGDDKFLSTLKRKNQILFGFDIKNQIKIKSFIDNGILGTQSVIDAFGRELTCNVAIPGKHVLYAVAAAVGVGFELGLNENEILAGLKNAATVGGRVNIIKRGTLTIIDDCYNAAPSSMKAGLDLLAGCGGETVAILGDMGELGDKAAALHAEVGAYAAQKGISLVVAVGELSKNIYTACVEAGGKAVYFADKKALIMSLEKAMPKDGTILVKASHFMGFSEIVDACGKNKNN